VVVVMRCRGKSWPRTIGAGFVAWLASAVLIVAWELVFALTLRATRPLDIAPVAPLAPAAMAPTELPYLVDWVAVCKPMSVTRLGDASGFATCADDTSIALTTEESLRRAKAYRWKREDTEFLPDVYDWIVSCDPIGTKRIEDTQIGRGELQCRDGTTRSFEGANKSSQVLWWIENMAQE
jgi:hypothetical protein